MAAIEIIRWNDSTVLGGDGWVPLEEVREALDDLGQITVGFIVAESEAAVAVARSLSDWKDPDTREKAEGVLVIPAAAITSRTRMP